MVCLFGLAIFPHSSLTEMRWSGEPRLRNTLKPNPGWVEIEISLKMSYGGLTHNFLISLM
jgi:hypothetical protein